MVCLCKLPWALLRATLLCAVAAASLLAQPASAAAPDLAAQFQSPPPSARPWVYWYFMDGHRTAEGLTADLEAMAAAGIGGAVFLEVDLGMPRGPVEFMSPAWRELFAHTVREAERLGIELVLGAGPGWCGTGGPWVAPEQSMQHLVASETRASGPARFEAALPQPAPRTPYFGEATLTPELREQWAAFYRDVAVLAFPTPQGEARIEGIDHKALVYRDPYSSMPGVAPRIPAPAQFPALPAAECIATTAVLDLSDKLDAQGNLAWDVPAGDWTILRFGRTTTGQATRPAPLPGLGFESDKFSRAAVDAHFEAFVGSLLQTPGLPARGVADPEHPRGLTTLHFDSWEMGSQNWTGAMRAEFQARRGYDMTPFLPAMVGRVVGSAEISERFLWDLRQTAQELVIENHMQPLKQQAAARAMRFSIEPYDLNPSADLELGGVADVPMCEFWSKGFGFSTEYSVFEAASIAHTRGRPVVAAEAFTAAEEEAWMQYPGRMKAQGDWAFCAGVNRFAFHRYQHQPALDQFPGMTMGPYGVHWERTQTWWPMVGAYHQYLARCQFMLRQGAPVADILYLTPEGAPEVFTPPASALDTNNPEALPDRRGYTFDGVAPSDLMANAQVENNYITFPGGARYALLVLPRVETMTPALLHKIKQLRAAGATIVGTPPRRSPSLADFPAGDAEVAELARELWSTALGATPQIITDPLDQDPASLYAPYDFTAKLLAGRGIIPDFESNASLRYIHRRVGTTEIYFLANRTAEPVDAECTFRVKDLLPEWWDPLTGEMRVLEASRKPEVSISTTIHLAPHGSGFVVFREPYTFRPDAGLFNRFERLANTPAFETWSVQFDPARGGPAQPVTLRSGEDWSTHADPAIRHYSGTAVYSTQFDLEPNADPSFAGRYGIELGDVNAMASVRLNGLDLGVAWCAPWQLAIPPGLLKARGNTLEITVANLWINRLIGDSALPEDQRTARTTWNPYKPDSPLQPSGLIGPVMLLQSP